MGAAAKRLKERAIGDGDDRLVPRAAQGAPFRARTLPTPDARTFLAARFKGSQTEDRWPCIGEVIVDLPSSGIAPWIDDGEVEELPDRRTRVRIGSWSWAGLLAQVARFDAAFTVVGPAPLHRAARELAARAAASVAPAR